LRRMRDGGMRVLAGIAMCTLRAPSYLCQPEMQAIGR